METKKELKPVNQSQKRQVFGEFIILPIQDYPESDWANVIEKLEDLYPSDHGKLNSWKKNKVVVIDAEDLHAVSLTYEVEKKRPLVHIYPSNSVMAKLPPSQIGNAPSQGGLAKGVYQGWQKEKGRDPVGGKLWLNVASIPTVTEPGGKTAPSEDEIKHYISQLYFYIAQGKSVCLPVRRINWAVDSKENKRKHFSGIYSQVIPSIFQDKTQKYEYAFGGGVADEFDDMVPFLEKELNQLNVIAVMLNTSEPDLDDIIKNKIPKYARNAFELGLNDKKSESLGSSMEAAKKLQASISAAAKIWKKVTGKDFLDYFKADKKYSVEFDTSTDPKKIKIHKEKDLKVVVTQKDYQLEAKTKNPTGAALEAMAEVMYKALGPEASVKININPDDGSLAAIKLKNDLWLQAMSKGLNVVGYVPSEGQFKKEGEEKKQKFLNEGNSSKKELEEGDDEQELDHSKLKKSSRL